MDHQPNDVSAEELEYVYGHDTEFCVIFSGGNRPARLAAYDHSYTEK